MHRGRCNLLPFGVERQLCVDGGKVRSFSAFLMALSPPPHLAQLLINILESPFPLPSSSLQPESGGALQCSPQNAVPCAILATSPSRPA